MFILWLLPAAYCHYYFQFRAHTSSLVKASATAVATMAASLVCAVFAPFQPIWSTHINDEWRRRAHKKRRKKSEWEKKKIEMNGERCDEWRNGRQNDKQNKNDVKENQSETSG